MERRPSRLAVEELRCMARSIRDHSTSGGGRRGGGEERRRGGNSHRLRFSVEDLQDSAHALM